MLLKKDVYNAKIKSVEDKILDITNLATETILNSKINSVKGEIPSTTNLATNAAVNAKINEAKGEITNIINLATNTVFTAVENKIPSVSNLVKLTITQKLVILKRKLLIIIIINILLLQFTAEISALRLKRANLASKSDKANFVNKTDFDKKLKDVKSKQK